MTEASLTLIRRLLVERYDELKRRLARRLGSAELAGEALQDAWLRIARVDSTRPWHSSHVLPIC
ncbi:DNA-directed RNA polymerase specialized sigma24 family protein [Bradyrhizobium sp. USDA 4341]